ncbi:MAG: hypothetical protein ACOYOK_00195 [Pseudobdellovibrionaceae bacterium]
MNSKVLKMPTLDSLLADIEQNEHMTKAVSLESIPENKRPVEDFRVLVSNFQTIEKSMTAKAKTLSQKTHLLHTWEKLKSLIAEMIDGLEKDIQNARRIEQSFNEAKEKNRELQMRSGIYSNFK